MLSRVAQCLVHPGNEQQLEQRQLCQLFLSSPSSNRSLGSLTWRVIRVSASSCEHGWSPTVFWPYLELTTPSNMVNMMTCVLCPRKHTIVLGTGRVHPYCHHFVRSLLFQFPGSLAWLDTRLLVHFPLFALVESFRLSFMYTSQTRSTRCIFPVPKKHTWDEYDLCIFGEGFRFPVWRNMHNTIHDWYFHMRGIRDSWISFSLDASN